MEIGTVISCSIGPNRDGTTPVRLAMCMVSGPTDIRTIQLGGNSEHNPVPGAKLLLVEVEDAWEIGIVLEDIAADLLALVGDKIIGASMVGGVIDPTAKLHFKAATHEAVFADGVDYAVAFNRMKIAFDTLKAEFDSHVHPFNGSIVIPTLSCSGTSSPKPAPSAADMTPAQVLTVRLP